ncbi:MAG: GNAT family N-acetyltransferase [Dermatophilaceae bacterium]
MIHLVRPDISRHREWLDLVAEFDGAHLDGSGLTESAVADMADPETFGRWVLAMAEQESGRQVPAGRVRCTSRWIACDGRLVGMVNLRHELTDVLLRQGGHIGYAVRPTARRHGVAQTALSLTLERAAALGINPVLLCCRDANVASIRTIENAGGVLEDIRAGWRRYWVTDPSRASGYAVRPLDEQPLRGRHVELPLVTPAVAEAMRSGARDPLWAEGFPRQDDIDALGPISGASEGRWGPRLIVRRRDGAVVGTTGFLSPPDERGQVEIGYGLVPSARGAGLVTDTLRLAVPAAEAAGAWVRARAASDNVPSRRALERTGFLLTGRADGKDGLRYERPRPWSFWTGEG